jgi:hypothetical protein
MSALAGGFTIVLVLSGLAPAQAGPDDPSALNAVAPITLTGPGDSEQFSTRLDTNCANAFESNGLGQTYSITATSSSPGTVGVSPAESQGLKCEAGKKNAPTVGTFTATAPLTLCGPNATVHATISLMPVAGNNGQQKKMTGPLPVAVTVEGVPACAEGQGEPPTQGTVAAAPSVANAYLNADDGSLTAACKANVTYKGNGWRGAVISSVAAWMPKPESVKNVLDETAWVDYVRTEVRHICGLAGADAAIPTAPAPYAALPAYNP